MKCKEETGSKIDLNPYIRALNQEKEKDLYLLQVQGIPLGEARKNAANIIQNT